ncbi:MAG: hypothetical protein RL885_22815 [Planctomycetota bacterium]
MSIRLFVLVSLLLLAASWLAGLFVYELVWPESSTVGLHWAAVLAFLTSSAGWGVAGMGLSKGPSRYPAYMAAGVLVKLIGLGLSVGLVAALDICSLQEFLLPFAGVFLIVFFGQMAVVVRAASERAERTES